MKKAIGVFLILVGGAVGLRAQRSFEFQSTVGLGYTTHTTPTSVVPLNDSTALIVSPSHTVNHRESIPRLMIVSDIHQGAALAQVFYYFFNPDNPGIRFDRPIRLDDSTACLFSEGPDGLVGTPDDGMNFLPNIDLGSFSQPVFLPFLEPGPLDEDKVVRIGDRWLAWPSAGADKQWSTGDEAVCYVSIGQNTAQVITIPITGGACDGYLFTMGDSAFGIRLTGGDGEYGTADDEVARISTTPSGSAPRFVRYGTGTGIDWPLLSEDWPKATGSGGLAYPSSGPDGILGNFDDSLVVVGGLDGMVHSHENRPVMGHRLWNSWMGPENIGVEPNGTIVLFSMGEDGWAGSSDDGIVWVTPTANGQDGNESLSLNHYLLSEYEESLNETYTLPCGTTVLISYGPEVRNPDGGGVLVIRPTAAGRVTEYISLDDDIHALIPMGDDAVLVQMSGGAVYHLAGLDGMSSSLRLVPGLLANQGATLQPISPSVVLSTRYHQPMSANQSNDFFQLWQVQATFNYGSATDSTSGYEMRAGSEERLPQLGLPYYTVTLAGAPINSPAWLMLSWQKSSVYVTPQAELLLDPERLFAAYPWVTFNNGTSSLPIPVPNDPDMTGMTWYSQWMVLDYDQPRGFQLSDGHTIVF